MDLSNSYLSYICSLVGIDDSCRYKRLIHFLMKKDFNYTIPMDGNREADGLDLRYRFSCDKGIPQAIVSIELDSKPCSILEMLIALSLRANSIITSEENASFIFWSMIDNLGFGDQMDEFFDIHYCEDRIEDFLDHNYDSNGEGGLVTLMYPPADLRYVEIWDQIMWWLDEM